MVFGDLPGMFCPREDTKVKGGSRHAARFDASLILCSKMMVTRTDSSRARISVVQLICGLVALAVAHAAYTFFLYRARALTHSAIASSDFLLFTLPAMVVYSGIFFLFRARAVRIIPPWVVAFLLTILSIWLSLLLPFNTYGT